MIPTDAVDMVEVYLLLVEQDRELALRSAA